MKEFRFKLDDYFMLQGGQIGMVGEMKPPDFPFVTQQYSLKLISGDEILHAFSKIGEEIPTGPNCSPNIRAFRTLDDIGSILKSRSDLYIVGFKR